jgi:hypothetical protein
MKRRGFCIFIDTFFQGPVPSVFDGEHQPVICDTEVEAQREIAEYMQIRLQQFMDAQRDFEDAITTEEYVVEVDVSEDEFVTDLDRKRYGPECV